MGPERRLGRGFNSGTTFLQPYDNDHKDICKFCAEGQRGGSGELGFMIHLGRVTETI